MFADQSIKVNNEDQYTRIHRWSQKAEGLTVIIDVFRAFRLPATLTMRGNGNNIDR